MKKYNTITIFTLLLIIGIFLILYSDTVSTFVGYKLYLKALSKIKDSTNASIMLNYDFLTIKFEILGVIFALYGGIGLIVESLILKYRKCN